MSLQKSLSHQFLHCIVGAFAEAGDMDIIRRLCLSLFVGQSQQANLHITERELRLS